MAIQFHNDFDRSTRLGNTRKFEKKAGNTVGIIKDTVQKQVETVKESAVHAEQEVSTIIKKVHGRTEGVKKDMKDGCHEKFPKIFIKLPKIFRKSLKICKARNKRWYFNLHYRNSCSFWFAH